MEYNFDDYFTIDECKRQLYIYHDEDNPAIIDKAEMSIFIVANIINRDIYPAGYKIPEDDKISINFNKAIRAACMLMLTDLFENRVISVEATINTNPIFHMILSPYKNYAIGMI